MTEPDDKTTDAERQSETMNDAIRGRSRRRLDPRDLLPAVQDQDEADDQADSHQEQNTPHDRRRVRLPVRVVSVQDEETGEHGSSEEENRGGTPDRHEVQYAER